MRYQTESWGKRGQVKVARDTKGRFVSWQRITIESRRSYAVEYSGKQVSVYGQASNGVGQRYDFYGSGRELYRAIYLAHRIVPKERFVSVSAREFLSRPYRYGEKGYWIDREIES
jgi:hypothetical protein